MLQAYNIYPITYKTNIKQHQIIKNQHSPIKITLHFTKNRPPSESGVTWRPWRCHRDAYQLMATVICESRKS